MPSTYPDIILHNGRLSPLVPISKLATAIVVRNGHVTDIAPDRDALGQAGPVTRIIDLKRRRVVPGLIQTLPDPLSVALAYCWDIPWGPEAMRSLEHQASISPRGHWVRILNRLPSDAAHSHLPDVAALARVAQGQPAIVLVRDAGLVMNAEGVAELQRGHALAPDGLRALLTNVGPSGGLSMDTVSAAQFDALNTATLPSPESCLAAIDHLAAHLLKLGITAILDPESMRGTNRSAAAATLTSRFEDVGFQLIQPRVESQVYAAIVMPLRQKLPYNPWRAIQDAQTSAVEPDQRRYTVSRPGREAALRMQVQGTNIMVSALVAGATLECGKPANLAVLSEDVFSLPTQDLNRIYSVLTVSKGKIVSASEEFSPLRPAQMRTLPAWSAGALRDVDAVTP